MDKNPDIEHSFEVENTQDKKVNKIGVIQMTSTSSLDENFFQVSRLVQEAKEAGAAMVFLPECFSFIGSKSNPAITVAENLDGPIMQKYRDLAAAHSIWMSLGGFQEKCAGETTKLFNTHVILDEKGAIVETYRKIHLFDVDFLGLQESAFTEGGTELKVVQTPVGSIGLAICYDLRFPEMFVALRRMGAEIILVPSAFTYKTGSAHWEVLLRARAIETQCYVIAAAQDGKHNDERESFGHSLVVDPWGVICAQCSEGPNINVCDISLNYVAEIRKKMPILEHRRAEYYK